MRLVDVVVDMDQLRSVGDRLEICKVPAGANILSAGPMSDGKYHVRYSIEDEPPTASVAIGDSHA